MDSERIEYILGKKKQQKTKHNSIAVSIFLLFATILHSYVWTQTSIKAFLR